MTKVTLMQCQVNLCLGKNHFKNTETAMLFLSYGALEFPKGELFICKQDH